MKKYTLCGIGNGIVDILLELSEAEFSTLDLEKGTTRLVDSPEQAALLQKFISHTPYLASGGSTANSVVAFSQLGGKTAFQACLGLDQYGLFYKKEFDALGIKLPLEPIQGGVNATCLALITPDAERTMRTCLGVGAIQSASHIDEVTIRDSEWIFIEGYMLANPDNGQGAVRKAVELAKRHNTKVALSVSESFIVDIFGGPLREIVAQSDLVFANEKEACSLAGNASTAEEAFRSLKSKLPGLVVTAGDQGAFVHCAGQEGHVKAFPCTPRDLTGAGDMFAGAFLYGINHNIPALDAARAANYLAREVIITMGARMRGDVKKFWEQGLSATN